MAQRNFEEINCEIESLNLDDLDVEELERRLEMSTGVGGNLVDGSGDDGGGGGGSCDTNVCGANCGNLCGVNCGSNCVGNGCGIDFY